MVGSLNSMFVSDIKGIILKVGLLFEEVTHDSHKMLTVILPRILIFFNIIYYKHITHCYVKITIESILFQFWNNMYYQFSLPLVKYWFYLLYLSLFQDFKEYHYFWYFHYSV